MSQQDHLSTLRSLDIFEGLPDESLQKILDAGTDYEAPAGAVLVQPNTAGAGLYVIEEGVAVVELPRRQVELGPGQFFGELSLLTERARTARVRAKTPIRCLAIPRDDFRRILETEPTVALHILEGMASRFAEMLSRE